MASEHDKRYKQLFSNPVIVEELLLYFVEEDFVKNLDFSTLESVNKSFITDEFKEKESDIIYKIQYNGEDVYIYLLIEFQSTVDRFMAVRMLRYIMEFYQALITLQNPHKLPAVFPILLYNGNKKWTAKTNVNDLVENTIPGIYIPDFQYYKIVENEIPDKKLLEIKNALSAVFYIENIKEPEEIRKHFKNVIKLIEKEEFPVIKVIARWLNNYLKYENEHIIDELNSLEEVKTMFATALKKHDREVEKRGEKRGKKLGQEKAQLEIAKKLLQNNVPLDVIMNSTGLSKKRILELKK